jgi:hypothetical protein
MRKLLTLIIVITFTLNSATQSYALRPRATVDSGTNQDIQSSILLESLLNGSYSRDISYKGNPEEVLREQMHLVEVRDILGFLFEKAKLTEREIDIVISASALGESMSSIRKRHSRAALAEHSRFILSRPDDGMISRPRVEQIRNKATAKLRRALRSVLDKDELFAQDIISQIFDRNANPFKSSSAGKDISEASGITYIALNGRLVNRAVAEKEISKLNTGRHLFNAIVVGNVIEIEISPRLIDGISVGHRHLTRPALGRGVISGVVENGSILLLDQTAGPDLDRKEAEIEHDEFIRLSRFLIECGYSADAPYNRIANFQLRELGVLDIEPRTIRDVALQSLTRESLLDNQDRAARSRYGIPAAGLFAKDIKSKDALMAPASERMINVHVGPASLQRFFLPENASSVATRDGRIYIADRVLLINNIHDVSITQEDTIEHPEFFTGTTYDFTGGHIAACMKRIVVSLLHALNRPVTANIILDRSYVLDDIGDFDLLFDEYHVLMLSEASRQGVSFSISHNGEKLLAFGREGDGPLKQICFWDSYEKMRAHTKTVLKGEPLATENSRNLSKPSSAATDFADIIKTLSIEIPNNRNKIFYEDLAVESTERALRIIREGLFALFNYPSSTFGLLDAEYPELADVTFARDIKTLEHLIKWGLLAFLSNASDSVVDNGIKEGRAEIEIAISKEYIEIKIIDNGVYIPEKEIPILFNQRIESHKKDDRDKPFLGRVGEALYILGQGVKFFNGTVSCSNRTDARGAEFSFKIPISVKEKRKGELLKQVLSDRPDAQYFLKNQRGLAKIDSAA